MFPVLPAVAVLIALASVVYAGDQRSKREKDLERFLGEKAALEEHLADKVREYRQLLRRLGKMHRQVRALAREVARLREALAGLKWRNVA